MKRVFISTGFAERDPDEIKADYIRAINDLESHFKESIQIMNGTSQTYLTGLHNTFYDSSLPWSLKLTKFSKLIYDIGLSEFIYFCKGWEKYRGCQIEHQIAESYRIPIYYEYPS